MAGVMEMERVLANPLDKTEETYRKYERLLDKIVWKLIRKYGGDFETLRADANLHYVRAVNGFDPSRSDKPTPYIAAFVYLELLDEIRREAIKKKRSGPVAGGEATTFARAPGDWIGKFLSTLSDDAEIVVKLCLDTPKEIISLAEDKGGCPRNYRSTTKEFLSSAGWSYERIKATFDEVKRALSS